MEPPATIVGYRPGRHQVSIANEDVLMSKEGFEGAAQKGVGSIKEAIGKATGDRKLQAEGVADKIAGSAKDAVGKAKDAIHKATK